MKSRRSDARNVAVRSVAQADESLSLRQPSLASGWLAVLRELWLASQPSDAHRRLSDVATREPPGPLAAWRSRTIPLASSLHTSFRELRLGKPAFTRKRPPRSPPASTQALTEPGLG